MKKVFFILALGLLFATPSILHAEETVIPLFEVVSMTPLPGDNAIDTTLSDEEIYAYNVYNPLGIVIKSDNGTINDIDDTLQNLESGLYVISVVDKNNQLVFSNKVYIEHK